MPAQFHAAKRYFDGYAHISPVSKGAASIR